MQNISSYLLSAFRWLETSDVGESVRLVPYLYPVLMSLHVMGLVVMLGSVFVFDLRLLGAGHRQIAVTTAAQLLLPVSRIGFVVVAVTGVLMFSGTATVVGNSAAAPWKFSLILAAALNIMVFHKGVYVRVKQWDTRRNPPMAAKIGAIVSMTVWTGVIFCGRFLSY